MKLTLLIPAMLIAKINSQTGNYISSVPQLIEDVLSVSGASCASDSDCDNLFNIPSTLPAFWTCVNDTGNATNVTDESFCQFTQCDTDDDCSTDETCYKMNPCDDDNQFYDESFELYSSICYAKTLCDDIKTEGQSTDTICYVGADEKTYFSEAEAILCGDSLTGTCVISSESCGADAVDCKKDKTCCTPDGWDNTGCLDLLFTEYLLYTVLGLFAVLIICCCCCCCLYKIRRKGEDYDEMDNQTNHYNVYI